MADASIEHLKVGRAQHDVVVKADTVGNGAIDVQHVVVPKCIPQPVKTIQNDEATFVAPLKGIDRRTNVRLLVEQPVFAVWRKQGVALWGWETLRDVR